MRTSPIVIVGRCAYCPRIVPSRISRVGKDESFAKGVVIRAWVRGLVPMAQCVARLNDAPICRPARAFMLRGRYLARTSRPVRRRSRIRGMRCRKYAHSEPHLHATRVDITKLANYLLGAAVR